MHADATLFDAYLDACLAGAPPDPATFLAGHGDVDAELRAKIQRLYETLAPRDGDALPFERIGDYRLLSALDAGGMGAVYLAEQESLGRVVALKLMRPEWARNEAAQRSFEREAHAVAQLRHPGIVTVFDAGRDGETSYLAMEMVPGRMLSDLLAEASMQDASVPPEHVVRWGARLARALDYAHGRGIVHRDVKPANIRITTDDEPMLLDFGIAVDTTGGTTTASDRFQGSPAYAAPEQIRSERVDARTDVYGLGVTLYQALTGAMPFEAATVEGIFHQVLSKVPVAPRQVQRGVSADLETVVLKAMEKRPADRYATAAAFAEDLEAVLTYRPVSARPPGPLARLGKWARRRPAHAVAAGGVVLFVFVLGVLALLQQGARERERREEAATLLTRAAAGIATYRDERLRAAKEEAALGVFRDELGDRYFTPAEDEAFRALESAVEAGQRKRDTLFHDVLAMLRRAESLDPNLQGATVQRVALFIEKYEEAKTARDPVRQAFFRAQAQLLDAGGDALARFAQTGTLSVRGLPPEARAWLFAYREHREVVPGGERRLVPVPVGEPVTPPVPYGSRALRVVRAVGGLGQGDLIFELEGQPVGTTLFVRRPGHACELLAAVDDQPIRGPADLEEAVAEAGSHHFRIGARSEDGESLAALGYEAVEPMTLAEEGGMRARVLVAGHVQQLTLPSGLVVRPTATPLMPTSGARVGTTHRTLPVGPYLLVVRTPGMEEWRGAVQIQHDRVHRQTPAPLPLGTTPAGFVHIPADRHGPAFFIMEREVTCEEYQAYLDDPAVAARIETDKRALVPRGPMGEWLWEPDGQRVRFGSEWTAQTPVMGVSFDDAVAYARWRGARDGVTYALPGEHQWNRATGHWNFQRTYTFGNTFFPRWVSSNWARKRARPEPWQRYPIDESPFGVFATAGGAMEWLDAWYDKAQTKRWLAGGAWGYADPVLFRSPGGWGNKPHMATGTYGFRLVRTP